jgi:hypothetical protein
VAWVKDAVSRSPKTVYTAPAEVFPMVRVVYDPEAEYPWTVEYAHLQGPSDTQESIEALIGV